ncbi:hypothetical protein KDW_58400 [Dictyobacter vulcani]|uniref:Condensation domain-containing protein n=1 Tax=Dictyobacter vulcani TaxID=2607529 RepID=A0A5J4KPP4_9CHLR|nr:hypothetical protein KDW_58400 [Dictyobacter vulcani]
MIHHLLVDGVSWRVLLEDIQVAYSQLVQNQAVKLAAKTTAFQQWAGQLQSYAQSEEVVKQLPYWLAQTDHLFHNLPTDHQTGANTASSVEHVRQALNREETRALLEDVPPAFHTQINDVLLTALALTLLPWSGNRALFVNLESHGREYLQPGMDLSRSVAGSPAYIHCCWTCGTGRDATADRFEADQRAVAPGATFRHWLWALRYLYQPDESLPAEQRATLEQLRTLPCAQLSFNYLGQFDQVIQSDGIFGEAAESSGMSQYENNLRVHLLDITASIVDGGFAIDWAYSTAHHEAKTIERLANNFIQRVRQIIVLCQDLQNSGYTPSDFPLACMTQEQIDRLLGNNRNVESVYRCRPCSRVCCSIVSMSQSAATILSRPALALMVH